MMLHGATTSSTSAHKKRRHAIENEAPLLTTKGSAKKIAFDGYYARSWPKMDENATRITMQIVDVALLKYKPLQGSFDREPCLSFQDGESTCLLKDDPDSALLQVQSRYRLQLSDGEHIVPGKFYPEWSPHVISNTRNERAIEIHRMVTEGEIQKGTIISFVPNSHPESGKGMVSIFDFDVGECHAIVGNPTPLHSGATQFSPSNIHHCTVPVTYPSMNPDPLPRPVLLLAKMIEKHCDTCAIAGSAPLAQYLRDMPGCQHCYATRYSPVVAEICKSFQSNDVDLFVPQYPEGLEHFQRTGEKIARHGKEFYSGDNGDHFLDSVLKDLYKEHGLRHTKIKRTKIHLSSVEEGGLGDGVDYGWMRIYVGLREKLEFKLATSTGDVIDCPIQILVMNTFPTSRDQSWSERVVNDFDLDVVKAVAHTKNNGTLEKVTFPSDSVLRNLLCGKFRYVMRPCHSCTQMWSRLTKYKNRGLEALELGFDPRVSNEWREHILNEFKIKLAGTWMKEWGNDTGVVVPEHVVTKQILSFLAGTAENAEKRKIHQRDMLRNMIREEIVRNNWRDPGYEAVDQSVLFKADVMHS